MGDIIMPVILVWIVGYFVVAVITIKSDPVIMDSKSVLNRYMKWIGLSYDEGFRLAASLYILWPSLIVFGIIRAATSQPPNQNQGDPGQD